MSGRVRWIVGVAGLGPLIAVGVVAWTLWPNDRAESQQVFDPMAVQPVLEQLAPGTTFHMAQVVYRRYGPIADQIPPEIGPETKRTDTWMTFDEGGALESYEAETRGLEDNVLLGTASLDGEDLVFYDASGVERRRVEGFKSITADGLRTRLAEATTEAYNAVSDLDDNSPSIDLGEQTVRVLEDRRPFSRGEDRGAGYSIPHVADLKPVEEVHREYVLPDEFRSLKTEVIIVDTDGTETVVESREFVAFEVIFG